MHSIDVRFLLFCLEVSQKTKVHSSCHLMGCSLSVQAMGCEKKINKSLSQEQHPIGAYSA